METLKVNGVSKHFGKFQVLQDINFTIKQETIYGLLGNNGAGKSTLLNIINDRNLASSGEVALGNHEVHNHYPSLQRLYLMSDANMYGKRMTVAGIFKLADEGYGNFDYELAHHLTKAFGINERDRLANLSTGLTTAAKITCALCVDADFIFLDEPMLGLDANHRDRFYRELMQTYEQRPRTFVLSTHIINEVQNLVEHVFILNNHQLIVDEDVDTLLANAYAISGPAPAVDEYTQEMKVLDQHLVGKIKTAYVIEQLDDYQPIPDDVSINHMDVQQAYLALTNGEDDSNE